jgi:ketosteroid isomerase-like protein
MSRRTLFVTAPCVLAAEASLPAAAHAQPEKRLDPATEAVIRRHYKAWDEKDWATEDRLLADDFTFSSAAGDDHISKAAFREQCWDTQAALIKGFNLLRIFGSGPEAFALYDCLTTSGKTFQNVEYFHVRDGQVTSIMCYFGAAANYPSQVDARPS